jgi:hypothetical protein
VKITKRQLEAEAGVSLREVFEQASIDVELRDLLEALTPEQSRALIPMLHDMITDEQRQRVGSTRRMFDRWERMAKGQEP